MSTRCQVKVVGEGLPWQAESVTLYHHSDGYPSYMLPLIREGYQQVLKKNKEAKESFGYTRDVYLWEGGRPGKAAAFLCAADPGGFEPEASHDLHSDIEWYYVVTVVNKSGGASGEKPEWKVDVYRPPEYEDKPMGQRDSGARSRFWDNPTFEALHLVEGGIPVSKGSEQTLERKGKQIEKRINDEWNRTHPVSVAEMNRLRSESRRPSKSAPGWHHESARHSLAARGLKTRRRSR